MIRGATADWLVVDDAAALARHAAREVVAALGAALTDRGQASWVLSGGSTPLLLFRRLAAEPAALDWRRVSFYWADERCVPPERPESNYGAARRELLDRLPVTGERVHRIRGELPPAEAVRRYERQVAAALAAGQFDLVLLGLGADGHTASLFPGALPAVSGGRLVAATTSPVPPAARVSLTPAALSASRRTIFMVAGESKAEAVAASLSPASPDGSVAGLVRPTAGRPLWLLDRAAAAGLR